LRSLEKYMFPGQLTTKLIFTGTKDFNRHIVLGLEPEKFENYWHERHFGLPPARLG
jgi:hypothetical protein